MVRTDDSENAPSRGWSIITRHDWNSSDAIETTLGDAIASLDGGNGATPLYEYIDAEAVIDVVAPGSNRGVSELRFEYEQHEIRIARDGTIAAR